LEFYDAHSPNAMYSLQMGYEECHQYPVIFIEILVWMVNNATNPDKLEE
jgi:4-hydroxy-tetrahydrodipicolinate synthase